jgi:hypothetical protein
MDIIEGGERSSIAKILRGMKLGPQVESRRQAGQCDKRDSRRQQATDDD